MFSAYLEYCISTKNERKQQHYMLIGDGSSLFWCSISAGRRDVQLFLIISVLEGLRNDLPWPDLRCQTRGCVQGFWSGDTL